MSFIRYSAVSTSLQLFSRAISSTARGMSSPQLFINTPVQGADQYYTVNDPPIGSALPVEAYPQNAKLPILFQPITIRDVTFKNRIFVSPMCQYSSDNGHATDWHLVHIGGFATRGVGAICIEATSVLPNGRISPEDAGLWTDSQIEPLKRIVNFCHAQGTLVGVQLTHGGRKTSTFAPFVHLNAAKTRRATTWTASQQENGWPDDVIAPSAISFSKDYPNPKEMAEEDLIRVEDAFLAAVERCKKIGFDFIDIHGAHGYLLHEFVSPLSNTRTDQYGGSLENRIRYPLRITSSIRKAWQKPLFYRLSATDWADGPEKDENGEWRQWGLEQSKILVGEIEKLGVDLVDVSTGGNWEKQSIPIGPGYQVPFAEALKKAHPKLVYSAVGLITSPKQAESYLQDGRTDVIFIAREFLRNPHWAMYAAQELGVAIKPANEYERAWMDVLAPKPAAEN